MGKSGMHFIPHLEKDIRRHWSGLADNPTSQVLLQGQAKVKSRLALNSSAAPVMAKLKQITKSTFCHFKSHVRLERNQVHWCFDKKWSKFLSVGLIFRQGWQWSGPQSTLLIPLRTTVLRVTTFEVPISSAWRLLSTRVLKCSCTVQIISLSVREISISAWNEGGGTT